jgi:hypothetical protein
MPKKQPEKMVAKIPIGTKKIMTGLGSVVGTKNNYNLQPEVTNYQLWPFSTIEWVTDQNKYRARVLLKDKATNEVVAVNSWHEDFADAKAAIDLVSDSLNGVGERRVYNIFGEVIETHTSDMGGGTLTNVYEVQGLIWSMEQY